MLQPSGNPSGLSAVSIIKMQLQGLSMVMELFDCGKGLGRLGRIYNLS